MVGKLFELDATVPYRHAQAWFREPTSGPERLRVGGGQQPVELLEQLSAGLTEPLFVLAVLRVPRTGDPGRLESNALTQQEVAHFLERFNELFANDARAQIWVGATDSTGLLILDEHDLIYAYGPLDAFEQIVIHAGYAPGRPAAPDPHEHHYNAELDPLEDDLRAWPNWRRVLPLTDDD